MSAVRQSRYNDALEIAKAVLSNVEPGKESAEKIADFIETLTNRLTEIANG